MNASIQQINPQEMVLVGDLNALTVVRLRNQFDRLISASGSSVNVDLSGVERSTSAGLSLLLCYFRKAKSLNKKLIFVSVPDVIFGMAKVSGLDEVLLLK